MLATPTIKVTVSDSNELDLHAFRAGDERAFRIVHDRLSRQLLYFVQNIIGSQPDAEDIVASAFCKLYTRARPEMESFEHIKRWLYVIARNEAIDYLRYRSRNWEVQENLSYMTDRNEMRADMEMLKSSLLQELQHAIDNLPQQRKTILRLYFFEQKSTTEIAEELQLSPQTVLNHKTRALSDLRRTALTSEWLLPGVLGLVLQAALFLLV